MPQKNLLRLLVLVNNFPPDRGGGAAVFGDMCFGLAERGFEVTVRCAYPYYPEWEDKSGRNGWRIWRYTQQGVRVERYGLYIPSNPNSLFQRLIHEISYLLSLLRGLFSRQRFDAVMAYCPAVGNLAYAVVHKWVFRTPLWLNVQDLAAQAAAAGGLVRSPILARALSAVQHWLFNRADVWSTISPVMQQRLSPMRSRAQPLHLRPNWLDAPLADEIARLNTARLPRQARDPLRLLYAGNIGRKQNLLELLRRLADSDAVFEFRVHGSGAAADEIARWLAASNDRRFSFGPFLDAKGFAAALDWTDYFVITETGDVGASFMPSKLIAGIAAGCPILTVCDARGPLGSEVKDYVLGPSWGWDRVGEISAFLKQHAQSHDEQYRAWSAAALRRARAYSREDLIAAFDSDFRRMT